MCPWRDKGTATNTQKEYTFDNCYATAWTFQPRTLSRKCSALLSISSRESSAPANTTTTTLETQWNIGLALCSVLVSNGLPCSKYSTLQDMVMKEHRKRPSWVIPWQIVFHWPYINSSSVSPFVTANSQTFQWELKSRFPLKLTIWDKQ